MEGFPQIADIFRETAEKEKGHAKVGERGPSPTRYAHRPAVKHSPV